jgi:hypothetical protein
MPAIDGLASPGRLGGERKARLSSLRRGAPESARRETEEDWPTTTGGTEPEPAIRINAGLPISSATSWPSSVARETLEALTRLV